MELRQLEYFMITCEKGSFNQAAECLYTTQPNVSKVISSLEKELGRPLFERSSRGIHITPYGETVREYAQNILHNVSLINSLTDHNQGQKFSLATYPSNMISRLLTDFYKEMGDSYIVEHLEGTVEEISVSYTKLATVDGKRIYIPNSDAASARICNYSVEGRRRVDLYIGVSYDAPAEKVREALLAAAQHPKALQDPAPLVVLNNYQDSSIQYLLMLWTASGDYLDVRFAVNEAVKRELDARGIAIPYPQLDVHFEPQKRNT